jgi:hypothetical protein
VDEEAVDRARFDGFDRDAGAGVDDVAPITL